MSASQARESLHCSPAVAAFFGNEGHVPLVSLHTKQVGGGRPGCAATGQPVFLLPLPPHAGCVCTRRLADPFCMPQRHSQIMAY